MSRRMFECATCGDQHASEWAAAWCCDVASNELHDPSLDPAEEFTIGKRDAPIIVDTRRLGITARAYGDNPTIILGED